MFKKIAPDKWRHFYVGILMGAVLQGAGIWFFNLDLILITVIVFLAVCAISYGFELFSKITGKGVYEVMDAVASVIGGVVGMGVVMGLRYWIL
jgi:hypothetical protein